VKSHSVLSPRGSVLCFPFSHSSSRLPTQSISFDPIGSHSLQFDTIIVQHYNRAMKNITIKLEDDVAHWSRVWAAEHNTSVSRMLGDLLKRMKKDKTGYAQAMQQFLSVKPRPLKESGAYPSRDDLHER